MPTSTRTTQRGAKARKKPRKKRRLRIFLSHAAGEFDDFHFYLKEWRQHRGMTQEQLADALNTSKGEVSRYERLQRTLSLLIQLRLARALRIMPEQLFSPPDRTSADAMLAPLAPEDRERYIAILHVLLNRPKTEP
jgi:transcriptional regulator with XRE-family HTH domain